MHCVFTGNRLRTSVLFLSMCLATCYLPHIAAADDRPIEERGAHYLIFWEGTDPYLSLEQLAAYCAPVFWYSADEPELGGASGKDIRIPAAFPFEEQIDSPVVYYQIRKVVAVEDSETETVLRNHDAIGASLVDLSTAYGLSIDYNHYYRHEAGLGRHDHDTEQVQLKIYVHRYQDALDVTHYQLYLLQFTGKAHALAWYDHIYEVDRDNLNEELVLPFHVLVEEGKHASITDMNSDGYYTPGYDVNVRTNDAWGLRDIIRTGGLFSPRFEAWMAKIRLPAFRVLPPLPADSPHRSRYELDGVYAPNNAVYQLRPMPSPEQAHPDVALAKDMESYYSEDWPSVHSISTIKKFLGWWQDENFIISLGVAARVDDDAWGVIFNFPLLIVKNVEAPLIGGWLVNRLYFQDKGLRDYGYSILYTPSASRFMDPYISGGVEVDFYDAEGVDEVQRRTDFVLESGIKIRGNVKYSPLKFLSVLTDFWGVRLGVKSRGFMRIDELAYVFEIGAGVW